MRGTQLTVLQGPFRPIPATAGPLPSCHSLCSARGQTSDWKIPATHRVFILISSWCTSWFFQDSVTTAAQSPGSVLYHQPRRSIQPKRSLNTLNLGFEVAKCNRNLACPCVLCLCLYGGQTARVPGPAPLTDSGVSTAATQTNCLSLGEKEGSPHKAGAEREPPRSSSSISMKSTSPLWGE